MTWVSTKIEDGGHLIQYGCRSKQDIKNGIRVLYIVLKIIPNEKIKKCNAISL